MNFVVAYSLLEKSDDKHCQMNELLHLVFSKFKGHDFCSKSYTKDCIAVAIGKMPISCDVEFVDYSIHKETLLKKLKFFTTIDIANKILSSKNPHKLAIWLWTRKECIYKYYNNRNILFSNILAQPISEIRVEENIVYTTMIRSDITLSYMHFDKGKVILLENKCGELYEKF